MEEEKKSFYIMNEEEKSIEEEMKMMREEERKREDRYAFDSFALTAMEIIWDKHPSKDDSRKIEHAFNIAELAMKERKKRHENGNW